MAVSTSTANDLMVVFSDTVTHGFTSLAGPVNAVLGTLIVLVVGLTGIQWALSPNREILASAVGKLLLIGAFAWLVNDWQHLSEVVFSGFLQLGLTAGGGGVSQADFFNPGAVLEEGWTLVKAMGAIQTHGSGPLDVAGNITDALILAVAMIGVMLAFAVLALQIIVTLLEFKIVTLGGFVLLPFGVWSKSAFLAERPLGYVVSAGLKVLALAIVISGAKAVFDRLIPSADPDIYEALSILVASILLALLAFFIPNIASALVTGGPSLGAGSALTAGLAVGGAAALGVGAIAGAGAAAGGALSSAGGAFARGSKAAAGATQGRGSSPPPSSSPAAPPTGGGGGSGGSSKAKSATAAAHDDQSPASNGGPAQETGAANAGAIVGRANAKAASRQGAPSPSAPTRADAPPVSETADATSAAAPASPQAPTGTATPSAAATPQVGGQPAASRRDVGSAALSASAASSAAQDASAPLSESAPASASGRSGPNSSAPRGQGRRTSYSPHAASLRAKRSAEASANAPEPLDPASASQPPPSAAADPANDDAARATSSTGPAVGAPTPSAAAAAAPGAEARREPSSGKSAKAGMQPRAPARRAFQLYWAANAARQLLPANETTGAVHPDLKREEA